MAAEWYYELMGDAIGPVSLEELIDGMNSGMIGPDTNIRKGPSGSWVMAVDIKGFVARADAVAFEAVEEQKREQQKRRKRAHEAQEEETARWKNLTVSTCTPAANERYKIIDTVFAVDSDGEAGVFSGRSGDPEAAFQRVKHRLREKAFAIGADAVINCQFEHRIASTGDGLATQQVVELFAYGTGIRLVHASG